MDIPSFLNDLLPRSSGVASTLPSVLARAHRLATTQLDSLISTPPSFATLVLLLVVLFLSLKLLNLLWRTLVFWLTLALRAIVLAGALALGLWVWARGLEGVVEDCQGLAEHWTAEYRRYSDGARFVQQAYSGAREGWDGSARRKKARW